MKLSKGDLRQPHLLAPAILPLEQLRTLCSPSPSSTTSWHSRPQQIGDSQHDRWTENEPPRVALQRGEMVAVVFAIGSAMMCVRRDERDPIHEPRNAGEVDKVDEESGIFSGEMAATPESEGGQLRQLGRAKNCQGDLKGPISPIDKRRGEASLKQYSATAESPLSVGRKHGITSKFFGSVTCRLDHITRRSVKSFSGIASVCMGLRNRRSSLSQITLMHCQVRYRWGTVVITLIVCFMVLHAS